MKKMFISKILIIGYLFMLNTPCHAFSCFKVCIPASCDSILEDVMGKQRESLVARLDDLIDTIKANTKQTQHQTKIIQREVIAYNALLARIKQESLSLKEASYLSKKIKDSESLSTTIDTTRKGK